MTNQESDIPSLTDCSGIRRPQALHAQAEKSYGIYGIWNGLRKLNSEHKKWSACRVRTGANTFVTFDVYSLHCPRILQIFLTHSTGILKNIRNNIHILSKRQEQKTYRAMEVNGDFQGVEDGTLPPCKKSKIIKWQPSGNKCDDELHLYDSGDMYDYAPSKLAIK
jgi:hypothetical protein